MIYKTNIYLADRVLENYYLYKTNIYPTNKVRENYYPYLTYLLTSLIVTNISVSKPVRNR